MKAGQMHSPLLVRRNHPGGENLGYCRCGAAVALVAGRWWHIIDKAPWPKHDWKETKPYPAEDEPSKTQDGEKHD